MRATFDLASVDTISSTWAVAVVFILIAGTVFTLFAIFGNLMKFLGADPAILERQRA